MYEALKELLLWANEANSRLPYEVDRQSGRQFGGNPFLNPVFQRAEAALARERTVRLAPPADDSPTPLA